MRTFLLKLSGAKKRNEIRKGKLWEITTVFGFDVWKEEKEPAKGEPVKRSEALPVEKMRVHIIKGENNVTNLTKDPNLL